MGSHGDDHFAYALSSNQAWAGYKNHQNPTFFPKLAAGQSPTILWLGCSDSRVPETTLLGLQPGDVFVHRNIANIISPTDINSSAVIEYAVAHLKVAHIVLCGHTSCGGAAAALGDSRVGGVLDTWLTPLKALRREHGAELKDIEDPAKRAVRLAELNVEMGVENLLANYVVDEHVRTRGVKVHGVLYDISSGKIRDLGVGNNDPNVDLKEEIKGEKSSAGPASAVVDQAKLEVVQGKHGQLVFKEDGFAYTQVQ